MIYEVKICFKWQYFNLQVNVVGCAELEVRFALDLSILIITALYCLLNIKICGRIVFVVAFLLLLRKKANEERDDKKR